jgi:hypothetical protein
MRVNMESSIAFDPRFKMLAKAVGVNLREVIGSCFMVWLNCYQNRSERLTSAEANASAEVDGFGEAMATCGLADDDGAGCLTIHGVKQRIRFLNSQSVRGKKGGRASAKVRKQKELAAKNSEQANAQPNSKQTLHAPGSNGQASSLTPSLTPAPALSPSFSALWKAYPRKDNRTRAEEEWDLIQPTAELLATMIAAIETKKRTGEFSDPSFVPLLWRWIHEKRWTDQPPESTADEQRSENERKAQEQLEYARARYGNREAPHE